jgi:hypothetical protein
LLTAARDGSSFLLCFAGRSLLGRHQ